MKNLLYFSFRRLAASTPTGLFSLWEEGTFPIFFLPTFSNMDYWEISHNTPQLHSSPISLRFMHKRNTPSTICVARILLDHSQIPVVSSLKTVAPFPMPLSEVIHCEPPFPSPSLDTLDVHLSFDPQAY